MSKILYLTVSFSLIHLSVGKTKKRRAKNQGRSIPYRWPPTEQFETYNSEDIDAPSLHTPSLDFLYPGSIPFDGLYGEAPPERGIFFRLQVYCKIPKISPRAYIFQRPFLSCLSMEGNLRFKIDWAGPTVGRNFTVFALFYFVFEGNFQVQPPGSLYLEGRFHGGFFALRV